MAACLDDHLAGGTTDRYPLNVVVRGRAVKDGRHTLTAEVTDVAGAGAVARQRPGVVGVRPGREPSLDVEADLPALTSGHAHVVS
jgi:pseudouridine-5'-phosphate glycosidase